MRFAEVVLCLKQAGWIIKDQKGSHVHMIHPSKPGKITIPKHGKSDLAPGTLKAIWKHAGLNH
ncbi:type II toxin-antitoxin system HicA family toxin [Dinghuibacter silviterrae]|uniref:Putative RNA binding protein YcfA (HicA-like mRNA interferase family) n=1 Tax=Dinghuibacter silviterrae TaxID=1539049 RepID=A0A4R8DFH9_9BACT|nr:type II toxin-antitoxin system HicA family toxin [Dinghuibacter silviterrae]TDW96187.1 putative RNA binding protein YcfA (HicA-like mRNA interferase family) [Dinghuibacter silviterrae]